MKWLCCFLMIWMFAAPSLAKAHSCHETHQKTETSCQLHQFCCHVSFVPQREAEAPALGAFQKENVFADYVSNMKPGPDLEGPFQPPRA